MPHSYFSRWLPALALLALPCIASAECTVDAPANSATFVHRHKVQHFHGEPPELLEDELKIWSASSGQACFALSTRGPNGHECGASGALRPVSDGRFRWDAGACSINLDQRGKFVQLTVTDAWRRRGAGGVCPQRYECGMFSAIESGRFVQRK